MNFYSETCSKEFSPNCFLATDIQIREQLDGTNVLDADEVNEWWTFNDPISWAKFEFDWDPRWYQVEPLRCTARKKVLRCGRQIGKTEILSLLGLFYPATRPNFRTVILCPYQDQVDIIFTRIRGFIQRSDTLSNPEFRIHDKMNPHTIEFYHPEGNSSLIGVTTGIRTGQKGDKTRGQTPSMLIVDEGDMLDDQTLESILASLTGTGAIAQMVVSFTPTGKRGLVYRWTTNKKMDFKEFHFTSKVSPNWTPELELFYRESYSQAGYGREFDAEFGEMEVSLFQHKHIELSLQDYDIKKAPPEKGEIYCFGVDWNRKGIGVHIVVVGYKPETGQFRVAHKEIIDAGDFTQLTAVNRLAELNKIWDPDFIYVDTGYGDTQIETLKVLGMGDPGSRLHRKVVGVDFGSKVVVRDPLTKDFVKKPVKPFMVDLCVRRVESGVCVFPKTEDTQFGLVGQLRRFTVVRYGREGQPVFTDDTEHTAIAWMLGVYGILMEMSDIAKVPVSTRVVMTGQLGQVVTREGMSAKIKAQKEQQKRLEPQPRTLGLTQSKKDREFDQFLLSFGKPGAKRSPERTSAGSRSTWEHSRKGRRGW